MILGTVMVSFLPLACVWRLFLNGILSDPAFFRRCRFGTWSYHRPDMEKDGAQRADPLFRKTVLSVAMGIIGALAFGVGMCFSMVWGKMIFGIVIGLMGIIILLCLIPLMKGIK